MTALTIYHDWGQRTTTEYKQRQRWQRPTDMKATEKWRGADAEVECPESIFLLGNQKIRGTRKHGPKNWVSLTSSISNFNNPNISSVPWSKSVEVVEAGNHLRLSHYFIILQIFGVDTQNFKEIGKAHRVNAWRKKTKLAEKFYFFPPFWYFFNGKTWKTKNTW